MQNANVVISLTTFGSSFTTTTPTQVTRALLVFLAMPLSTTTTGLPSSRLPHLRTRSCSLVFLYVDPLFTLETESLQTFQASPLGANGSPSGSVYYATPAQLATIVNNVKGNSNFGGVMMWAAGFSDANVNDGCTYAQEAKHILLTGSPCSSGPVTASLPPVTSSTTTSKPPGSSQTAPSQPGSVPQWGQVSFRWYIAIKLNISSNVEIVRW